MTGFKKRLREDLVASDAGIGADVEIFQVAHASGDAVGMGIIRPGVGAQPVFGRAVTAFAGDAFADGKRRAAEGGGHLAQR